MKALINKIDRDGVSQEQKSVIILLTAVYGYLGGIEKFNQRMLSSYSRVFPGRKLNVLVLEDGQETNPLESNQLKFQKFRTRPRFVGKLKFSLGFFLTLIRERPQEVIVGHVSLSFLVALLAPLFKYRYSLISHGAEVSGKLNWFRNTGMKRAARIMAVSRCTLSSVRARTDFPDAKLRLLPNTCDEMEFKPGPVNENLKRKFDLNNCRVLLTVGRLASDEIYKGVDTTLKAIAELQKEIPLKYIVVGDGDGRATLEVIVRQLNLNSKVHFVGRVSDAELVEYYRLANCFVMPSKEGFGIAYLEAMLCGIPVIASNNDGSGEPLQDGKLGWRVAPGNSGALVSAIREALSSKDPRCSPEVLRAETIRKFGLNQFDNIIRKLFDEDVAI